MCLKSIASTVSMLAVCLVVAACAGSPVTTAMGSDQGSDMQPGSIAQSQWVAGPDNGQY